MQNLRYWGLRTFVQKDNPIGFPAASVRRICNMLTALAFADSLSDLQAFYWRRLNPLKAIAKGNRTSPLPTIGGSSSVEGDEIVDLDCEDYH